MSKSAKSFIFHGGILAIAGILVRIIGMLYRIPMVNIIGSEGNGIYGVAFNIYNIVLTVSYTHLLTVFIQNVSYLKVSHTHSGVRV